MEKHTFLYEVTPDGKVYSIDSNWRGYGRKEMKATPNAYGYLSVRLTINGKRKRFLVHKLVAEKYLGPKPTGLQIRHLNGIRIDCRVENLAYGTAKENADDRERHGKTSRGIRHSNIIRNALLNKQI